MSSGLSHKQLVFIEDLITRTKARRHPGHFAEYVLGVKNAWFHWEWYEHLLVNSRDVKIAARGHSKSTSCTVAYPLWQVGDNPNVRIGICSASAGQAEKFLREIDNGIRLNPRYRKLFGDLFDPDQIWTQKQKTVRRSTVQKDATFLAVGVGSGFAGSRTDVLIFDDLVDKTNAATLGKRRGVYDWLFDTAMPTLDPTYLNKAIMVGTPYHVEDALMLVSQVWPTRVYPAVDQAGAVLWPERFTLAELDTRRGEMGEYHFSSQYLCVPVGVAGNRLKREWLRESQESAPEDQDWREVWSIDWAVTPDVEAELHERDYSVIMRWRLREWGAELYDLHAGRWALPEVLDEIETLAKGEHPPEWIAVEANGVGKPSMQMLKTRIDIPVYDVLAEANDLTRYDLMSVSFQNGELTLARDRSLAVERFIAEWVACPYGAHDDTLAAAYVLWRNLGLGGVAIATARIKDNGRQRDRLAVVHRLS